MSDATVENADVIMIMEFPFYFFIPTKTIYWFNTLHDAYNIQSKVLADAGEVPL